MTDPKQHTGSLLLNASYTMSAVKLQKTDFLSLINPKRISWGSHLSRKFEVGDSWAPGLNSWRLSNRAKLRFCPQTDKNKNDTYFPFSTDMEEIK